MKRTAKNRRWWTVYFLKKICVYLPKRDELSLRTVVALPKLSSRGEASRICSVTSDEEEDELEAAGCEPTVRLFFLLLTAARYCMMSLVASVLPAPLSPLIITTCGSQKPPGSPSRLATLSYAAAPIANKCLFQSSTLWLIDLKNN